MSNYAFSGADADEYVGICTKQDAEAAKCRKSFDEWIKQHISCSDNADGSTVISYEE